MAMEFKNEGLGVSGESHEIESSKIGIMRALVEREDPTSKDVDDNMLRRFLRARELHIEKASKMFLKYLSWKRSFVPNGRIRNTEISHELLQNEVYLQGHDKKGQPILIVFGHRYRPFKSDREEFQRFVVYTIDLILSRMPPETEKFVAIVDLRGWGCSDIRDFAPALSILQDYYPERLGRLLLVHVPFVFMIAWKLMHPFIDNKTKKKISFVENKKLKTTLLAEIDEGQLPDVYGGQLILYGHLSNEEYASGLYWYPK